MCRADAVCDEQLRGVSQLALFRAARRVRARALAAGRTERRQTRASRLRITALRLRHPKLHRYVILSQPGTHTCICTRKTTANVGVLKLLIANATSVCKLRTVKCTVLIANATIYYRVSVSGATVNVLCVGFRQADCVLRTSTGPH